jgi:hypothetical protein
MAVVRLLAQQDRSRDETAAAGAALVEAAQRLRLEARTRKQHKARRPVSAATTRQAAAARG